MGRFGTAWKEKEPRRGAEEVAWPPRWDLGPEHRGPGLRGPDTRRGRGAPCKARSRAPVLTVHRGEGICFAVHIHGDAEEREQRGRRRRVASQTQLQDLRGEREGRWEGVCERVPGCGGARGAGGATLLAGSSRAGQRARRAHREGNFPPSGRGADRSAERPRVGGRDRRVLGAHGARRSCGQRAEAGLWGERRLAQLAPRELWHRMPRRARSRGRPEGAGPGRAKCWRVGEVGREVAILGGGAAGASGRGERGRAPRPPVEGWRASPRPRAGKGGNERASEPSGAGGCRRAGPRWVAAARRLGRRLELGRPVCVSLKAAKPPPDPLPLPALGDG